MDISLKLWIFLYSVVLQGENNIGNTKENWWKSSNGQIHYFCKGKTPLTAPSSLWKFGKYQISHFSTSERCSKKSFPHAKTKNLAIWAFSSICLYSQYYFHPIGPHCIKIFTVLGLCPLVTFARQNVRLIWNPNIYSTVLISYCVFRPSIWWNVAVSIQLLEFIGGTL